MTVPGVEDKARLDKATVRSTLISCMEVVETLLDQVEVRLVGTAATVLRGVAFTAGDIDFLLKHRADVDRFDSLLSKSSAVTSVVPPVWRAEAAQYFARYILAGTVVELSTVEFDFEGSGDTFECIGRGPWVHYDLLPCGPFQIPVVATELRLLSEIGRNRPEKFRPILEYMREYGCDLDLLRRKIQAS